MGKLRIYVADDHVLFRSTIAKVLEWSDSRYEVREAPDGKTLFRLFSEEIPDIAIVSLDMPVVDGFKTCAKIAKDFPEVRIIALSMHNSEEEHQRAIGLGAHAFISKYSEPEQLTQLILDLSTGRYVCHPLGKAKTDCSDQQCSMGQGDGRKIGLTQREFDIVNLLCREFTNKQIGYQLGLSQNTIRNHKVRIMNKATAKSTAGLVRMAYENLFFVYDG